MKYNKYNDAISSMTSKHPLFKTTIKPVPKDYHNGVNEIYNKGTITQEWMILWDIHNEK